MKPVYWTEERLRELSKKYKTIVELKNEESGAYKALLKLGLNLILYPIESRPRHPEFTFEKLKDLSLLFPQRAKLQHAHPSAYNAARNNLWLDKLFTPPLNRKYKHEELKQESAKYRYRSEFEKGSPKHYQVAQKRKILDEICGPKIQGYSIAEKELLSFLQSLQPDFKTKRFKNDYELDCFSETLNLGIEYNGLYWHSEATKKNARLYHINKTDHFGTLGIRVIHIWEHEWRDRKEQVKNFLRSACNANKIKIGARKCDFIEISIKDARAFLNSNHIQGYGSTSSMAIGVLYKEELIGVASFGKHHRQNGLNMTVLNRMAFKPEVTIQGGVQKITKLAYELYGPLQSWADLDKSQANGYLKAGWTVKHKLRPDYFYIKPGDPAQIISKQSRRKRAMNTPLHMTEREHALLDGLTRVWNCGKTLLIYDPKTIFDLYP